LTVAETLRGCVLEPREARLLLAHASGLSDAALVAWPDWVLGDEIQSRFQDLVQRRARGEPIAYLLGRKEFYGLELRVTPEVLIPRPETELLVEQALARAPRSVLDLGTGSGAVALAIKRHLPAARVVAVEDSAAALSVARQNARALGLEIDLRLGHWFEPVAKDRFDVVVANPPYVASGDPHLEALRHEPQAALVAGADGLDAVRDIVARAAEHLHAGGVLLLEHGYDQSDRVQALLTKAGFGAVRSWRDLAGIARVSGGEVKS
jgi:release factor glutamine methyltransferase